jgi:hypothetical protein
MVLGNLSPVDARTKARRVVRPDRAKVGYKARIGNGYVPRRLPGIHRVGNAYFTRWTDGSLGTPGGGRPYWKPAQATRRVSRPADSKAGVKKYQNARFYDDMRGGSVPAHQGYVVNGGRVIPDKRPGTKEMWRHRTTPSDPVAVRDRYTNRVTVKSHKEYLQGLLHSPQWVKKNPAAAKRAHRLLSNLHHFGSY